MRSLKKLLAVLFVVAFAVPVAAQVPDDSVVWAPAFAHGAGWTTDLVLKNPTGGWVEGEISVLTGHAEVISGGLIVHTRSNLATKIAGKVARVHRVSIPPGGGRFEIIPDPEPSGNDIVVGYLRVRGPWYGPYGPGSGIEGELVRKFRGKEYPSQLSRPSPKVRLGVKYVPGSAVRPAFAVVNTGDDVTDAGSITIRLLGNHGQLVTQVSTDLLWPGDQLAVFVDELFVLSGVFEGVLEIDTSDARLVATALDFHTP